MLKSDVRGIQDSGTWEWSVFWQSDQLESCMPISPGDCDRLIAVWRSFFDALPDGARILDLGTGNGSVVTHAAAVSRTRPVKFSIHGVDLADIDPVRFVTSAADPLKEVNFHPGTPMEKLPFSDRHFDAVSSQYAIEYSRTSRSLPEALRVLRPEGRFRFLLHADNGVLKDRCRRQRQQAEEILASNLFPCLVRMLEEIAKAEKYKTAGALVTAERAISNFKEVLDDLDRRFAATGDRSLADKLFAAVRRLPGLRRSHDAEPLAGMAAGIEKLLVAQARRLQAMENAALDEGSANELAEQLRGFGGQDIRLEQATAGANEVSVGYWLYGCRGAGD